MAHGGLAWLTSRMTFAAPLSQEIAPALPRADGAVHLSTKATERGSGIDRLYQRGALKLVFPRGRGLTGVLVNTSGGVTGGDRFDTRADVGTDSDLTLTTQAAERAYKALPGSVGRVRTRLSVAQGSRLAWVPQETIIFDGADLDRRLTCHVADNAELLVVEPMIFGRTAMGEATVKGHVRDRIEIHQNGKLRYLDQWELTGDITGALTRAPVADGAAAMATILHLTPRAEALLAPVRAVLPQTAGASLRDPDLLCIRLLATDGYRLRQALLPLLDLLTDHTLPTCWRL